MKFISIKHLAITLVTFCFAQYAIASGSYSKETATAPQNDVVDTAVLTGSFNTLATALVEADLVSTLKGDGPFTVFAPTDEAFNKIPTEQLNAILADKELLKSILTYHVVAGQVMAEDVVKLESATTLQGKNLNISTTDGVTVNGARVLKTDILGSNGVIHVIDTVLVPDTASEVPAE